MVAADWEYFRVLFGLTLSGRWSRAIEWRGSTLSGHLTETGCRDQVTLG
jgi:hypothetical protein